jgi:hypothetical protein
MNHSYLVKKYFLSSLFIFSFCKFAHSSTVESDKKMEEKATEIELAVDWLIKLKNNQDLKSLKDRIDKYPASFTVLGKTYITNGIPNRIEIPIYILVRNQNSLIYFSIENNIIKFYFGAPVSPATYQMGVRNSSYLLVELPPEEKKFREVLKSVVLADSIAEKNFYSPVVVKGQDPFNREVQALGSIAITNFDIDQNLSKTALQDYMLTLWMALEQGVDLVAILDSIKPLPLLKTCNQYLN